MQSILQDIKTNTFRRVYLLYGTEAYLRKQYRDKLRCAIVPENVDMNYTYYEGKDVTASQVIERAQTLPFFADKRLVIVENSPLFKSAGEALADFLKSMPDTTYMIFVEEAPDKRSRLYKEIINQGKAVEFKEQDDTTLRKWVQTILGNEGKSISPQAITVFLEKTGTDMANIRTEIEKLICYLGERTTITEEDVDAICSGRVVSHIFDMITAIAEKKQKVALQYYYDLLELKEPPMLILSLLARQFNQLLQIKEMREAGYSNAAMASTLKISPYIIGKIAAQAQKFSMSVLRSALGECVEADESIKQGKMNDRMCVELLIVKYSGI